MKKFLRILALVVVVVFAATPMFGADVTGKWTGEASTPNGSFQLSFSLKQEGTKLTGTLTGPQGDPIDITNGVVDGDKVSFDVSFNGITIHHAGTVQGDVIKVTSKSDQADFSGNELTLKRVK